MANNITLAMETAVGSGSLSLFESGNLLDEWCVEDKISRSDRFLPILDEFLKRNKINKKKLDLIAVSRGPGSFTGARIGLATAAAMKNGLGIKCLGISVLQAIAFSSMPTKHSNVIAAILNDKTQIIRENFKLDSGIFLDSLSNSNFSSELKSDGANLLLTDDFISEIKSLTVRTQILLERTLFDLIDEKYGVENLKKHSAALDFEMIGNNLSVFIGRAVIKDCASDNLKIIYSNTDDKF